MALRLRILSGAHQGAELELTTGDWTLGSDPLCDILLSDLSPRQATLRVAEDGTALLLPDEGQNMVDGEPVPQQGAAVAHFALMVWGTVYAALGPDAQVWPQLALPKDRAMPTQPDPAARLTPAAAELPAAGSAGGTKAAMAKGLQLDAAVFSGNARGGKKWGKCLPRLILAALLLILAAGGTWQWMGPDTATLQRQNIEAVLRAEGLKPSAYTIEEGMDAWTVHGTVGDEKKLQETTAALQGLGYTIRVDIVSLQVLVEALEARIHAEGARMQVSVRGDVLRLSGYVYDVKSLDALLAPLREQCTRAGLKVDVAYWQELKEGLRDSLRTLKLENTVRLTPGPYTIAMDITALPPKKHELLRILDNEVADMARGISPLIRPTPAGGSSAPMGAIPSLARPRVALCDQLKVTGQGEELRVRFDGKDYKRGAQLPNGLIVQEVRPEYVTLVQGNKLVYCPAH